MNDKLLLYCIVTVIGTLYFYFENKIFSVSHYKVTSKKIPTEFEGVKIALLADLHNNTFGKNNRRLLQAIDKEKPDYIMIAGDMIVGEKNADTSIARNLIFHLSKKYPIYYGTGNHEQRLGLFNQTMDTSYLTYKNDLRNFDVNYLVNETRKIHRGNAFITVTGLQIHQDYYKKVKRPTMTKDYLENEVGIRNEKDFNILIAHNPMYAKQYAKWGADLTLCGHVHGGIVRLPFLGGVISPQYVFFPKYDAGQYEENNKTMIISRGLGTHTIKIRLFNKPELAIIQLKQQ